MTMIRHPNRRRTPDRIDVLQVRRDIAEALTSPDQPSFITVPRPVKVSDWVIQACGIWRSGVRPQAFPIELFDDHVAKLLIPCDDEMVRV